MIVISNETDEWIIAVKEGDAEKLMDYLEANITDDEFDIEEEFEDSMDDDEEAE